MYRTSRLLMVGLCVLGLATCNGDNGTTKDGAVDGVQTGDTGPVTPITCAGDCADLVMNKLTLPDATTASQIGWDYNNDGSKDNALGSILGALGGVASGMNIQESVDGGVNGGSTILLLRVQAQSFADAVGAKLQTWVGAKQICCKDSKATTCASEAAAKCFNGTNTFWLDPNSPKDALFGGKITSGKFHFGPAKLRFNIPFTGAGNLELDLKAVHITGSIGSDGKSITSGVLAGAISKTDLDTKLIPTVATMLEKTYTDPKTEQSTKNTIKTLFDTNSDGHISKDEVANNTLIKTFLAGDVDVDGDKINELSLAVGFTAVGAKIDDKNPAPDLGVTPDQGGAKDGGAKQ